LVKLVKPVESFGNAGFTLVELLVVILIMALGTSMVVGRVSFGRPPAQVEALRLAALLEHAGTRARTTGQALAFQLRGDAGYRFLRHDDPWQEIAATDDDVLRPRRLPEGVGLRGDTAGAAESIVLLPAAGLATRFSLHIASPSVAFELRGDEAGRVVVVMVVPVPPPASP